MHRKHCLKFFTLVLLSLVLSCCQDQLVSDWSSEGSLGVNVRRTSNSEIRGLEEARNFYMNSERILASASSRAEGEKEVKSFYFPYLRKNPSWKFYICNQKDSMQVVEVDLTDCISQDYILRENWEGYKSISSINIFALILDMYISVIWLKERKEPFI